MPVGPEEPPEQSMGRPVPPPIEGGGEVSLPKPSPTTLPTEGSFALPGTRAARGFRMARGLPRQANLEGQPFGSPTGGNDMLLDYILKRMQGGG